MPTSRDSMWRSWSWKYQGASPGMSAPHKWGFSPDRRSYRQQWASRGSKRGLGFELAQPYEFQLLTNLFWIPGPSITQAQRITRGGSADSVWPASSALPCTSACRARLQWVWVVFISPQHCTSAPVQGLRNPTVFLWIQDAFHTYSKDPQALKA